jgi:hypothetical protein
MKRVAVVLLLIAAGSARAEPFAPTPSDSIGMEDASTIYAVDEDRDGRTDRFLILEQSDSLA